MDAAHIIVTTADDIQRAVGSCHPALAAGRTVTWPGSAPETVVLLQELRDGHAMDRDAIARAIHEALTSVHANAERIVLVAPSALAIDGGAAIDRDACRQAYVAGAIPIVDDLTAPAAPPDAGDAAAAAGGGTAAALARLWSKILDVDVDAHVPFIDFTDSLSAMEYVNRVRDTFHVDIPARALFDRIPDIERLAALIDATAPPATAGRIEPPRAGDESSRAPAGRAAAQPARRDHAVTLPGGDWSMWRTVVVRGAGFPVAMVRDLAGRRAGAAADGYIDRCASVTRACEAAEQELGALIGRTGDSTRRAERRRARRRLRSGVVRAQEGAPGERALADAIDARDASRTVLEAAHHADSDAAVESLRGMLHDPRFREAILWQNSRALRTVARRFDAGDGSEGDRRNAALFVAMAAQRYATKNDSIGFFGPIGWGSLVDDATVVDMAPGPRLLARREVYFEGWAIDAFASRMNGDPALKPWCSPRVRAGVWIGPDVVCAPLVGQVPLRPEERDVLGCCDGVLTAREIAARLLAAPHPILDCERAVFDAIERLVALKLVTWQFEVASQRYPERELLERIGRIGDLERRLQCEAALRELCDARARVAVAAGDHESLEAALADLDATFTRLTGAPCSRRAGEMYAGRALVFEDCRRDCAVAFGGAFLARLGPALTLVLDGARWVTTELRAAFGRHLRAAHAALRARVGADALDAHLFMNYVGAGAREALEPVSADIRRRYRDRWRSILAVSEDERRAVTRAASELRARASEAFAVTGPSSWGGYFTPDIMIAAEGLDALRRGAFTCVLGEIHSSHTLLWSCLTSQHPDISAVEHSLAGDIGGDNLVLMQIPKARWLARLDQMTLSSIWRYEYGDDPPSRSPCRSLPAGLLIAIDDGTGVRIRAKDGRVEFDAYDLFAVTLSYEADRIVSDGFSGEAHTPRIAIDDVVVSREQWHTSAGEMTFLREKERAIAFALVRQWARSLGMPRYVFYKSPGETKPCYLDFESPVYVDAFLKLMRRLRPAASVRIVEMLPDPNQTWLVDAAGARYTCEIRIAGRAS